MSGVDGPQPVVPRGVVGDVLEPEEPLHLLRGKEAAIGAQGAELVVEVEVVDVGEDPVLETGSGRRSGALSGVAAGVTDDIARRRRLGRRPASSARAIAEDGRLD
jgi:hypothetical protein